MTEQQPEAIAAEVLDACQAAGLTLATAESCTGGLIAGALTAHAGSSAVVERGFVTYANAAKTDLLGVPRELIERLGAVSEAVARAMAEGALARAPVDMAISVTGIAGPGGGTAEKPVGLVHMALARRGGPTRHEEHRFPGDRTAVRRQAAVAALDLVLRAARRGDGPGSEPVTDPQPVETVPPPKPLPATALPVTFWGLVLLALVAVGLVFAGGGLILLAGALLSGAEGPLLDRMLDLGGGWRFVLVVTAWQFVAMMLAIRYVGMRRAGLDWRGMGLRPVGRRWWLGGFALALLTIPVGSLVTRLTQILLDLPLDMPQLEVLAPEGFQPIGAVGMTLLGGLAIPLAEELLFRGFLHGWLRRHLAFWPAALIGSGLFGLVHGQIAIIPGTFLVGMVLVWARERSGTLTAPWIIHGAFNGVQLVILYWALAVGVDLADIPV